MDTLYFLFEVFNSDLFHTLRVVHKMKLSGVSVGKETLTQIRLTIRQYIFFSKWSFAGCGIFSYGLVNQINSFFKVLIENLTECICHIFTGEMDLPLCCWDVLWERGKKQVQKLPKWQPGVHMIIRAPDWIICCLFLWLPLYLWPINKTWSLDYHCKAIKETLVKEIWRWIL